MKKLFLVIIALLECCFIFGSDWSINEQIYTIQTDQSSSTDYFYYVVTSTPEKYSSVQIGTSIYSWQSGGMYRNLFTQSNKDKVLEYLNSDNFELYNIEGYDCVFLPFSFLKETIKISEQQLEYIWNEFENNYIAFSDMMKKGFSKKKFFAVKTYGDLVDLFDQYIDDAHFNFTINDTLYKMQTAYDEGSVPSIDADNTYYEVETSNAYYVRFTNCTSDTYLENMPTVGERAAGKDFLILDARTNYGGNNYPVFETINYLIEKKYKGTIYVLQDNWSFSSGELWSVIGGKNIKLNKKLVGTHSGGMQKYGNIRYYENKELGISMRFGSKSFVKTLPKNYLGEGKGFEPEIWASTPNIKSILESFGIDLTGIEFQ